MATFTAIALASLAAGAVGAGVAQGQQASRAMKQGLRRQDEAQRIAESQAIRQRRENEMQYNKANAKQPDIAAILAGEQSRAQRRPTMLTGVGGADDKASLGGAPSLLGT